DARMRPGGFGHPRRRHQLAAVPLAAAEVELAQGEQVAAAQGQATAGLGQAQRRELPGRRFDAQRIEQLVAGIVLQGAADGGLDRGAERGHARGAVAEAAPVRRILRSRSEEHTSELQSRENLVCRLLLEKKNKGTEEVARIT